MRVIDYALTRGIAARVAAGGFHGSDHRLVTFDVHRGDDGPLRIGLWNMQRDRPRGQVASTVAAIMSPLRTDDQAPDVLLLCEAGDYLGVLRTLDRVGLRLVAFWSQPGQSNTAIVVRDGLRLDQVECRRMNRTGWITVRGGRTPAKWVVSARVDGWLRVGVGHLPPSVRWRRLVVRGPVRRVAAYVRHARRLVQWAHRHPGPLLVACDWNATPGTRGAWSPHWIARRAGLRVVAPSTGTHR